MFEIGSVASQGSGTLDELTAAVDRLQETEIRAAAGLVDTVADIAVLHAQIQRLQSLMLDLVRTCDTDGGHHLAGYATTGTMLTDGLRLAPGQGQAMVNTARALHSTFGKTREALADGEISSAHATAITRAGRKLPSDVLEEAEPVLLEVARVGSPTMVRGAVDRMAELLEPEHFDHDLEKERERRYLDVSQTKDGWWAVDGHLPPDIGARLSSALEQFAATTDLHDIRTAKQRRADAIGEISDASLAGQTAGVSTVTIVADADQLDGSGAQWDDTGLPVGLTNFAMAVCQSRIQLVVADRSGVGWKPLAVGMLTRFATPAQRAALRIRDGRCVYRGCTRKANRCHAHHVIDWRDGGATDLSNLVLLCPYHHRMVHLGRAEFLEDPESPGRRIAVPTRRHTHTAA